MLYKTIEKRILENLVDIHLKEIECIGPQKVGTDAGGKPLYQFLPFEKFDDIDLEYDTTEYSAKTYFIPYKEILSRFTFSNKDWQQEISYKKHPRVLIGLHPCDINALIKLDKVFAKEFHPNPYYLSRRGNTLTIGIDCEKPCTGGFCASMGTDTVTHGFDLFLTDIGDRYFLKVGSDRAFILLNKVGIQDITEEDRELYLKKRNQFETAFERKIRVENLPNLLDIEFESDVWKKWGDQCLSCGSCAMVCPTCYCYGVTENMSMDFTTSEKVKQLYSCNLYDFAQVAGGHNFRPDRHTRLKYRYYHQHRGFVDTFGQPMCVGCNRCGRACLAGINPTDVIQDLQMEQGR
ncbi:MAG: 4Fe-4S dicluster domain-containing protein [Desulfobacterales bacterium]